MPVPLIIIQVKTLFQFNFVLGVLELILAFLLGLMTY